MTAQTCVIGIGEVGFHTLMEIQKKIPVVGVEKNRAKLKRLQKMGLNVFSSVLESKNYIICVYSTEQVLDVLKQISGDNNPLIVIESTIDPAKNRLIQSSIRKIGKCDLVLFPHRFNPNDPIHQIFNLNRVMGGKPKSIRRAVRFYSRFMNMKRIFRTSFQIASVCKPLENAYRFIEIAIAEEFRMLADKKRIDFLKLRNAMNSKWNISVRDAKRGIGGKCLPKDVWISKRFFPKSHFITEAILADKKYRKWLEQKTGG